MDLIFHLHSKTTYLRIYVYIFFFLFLCEELILEVRPRILHTPSVESSGGIVGE
jgi:hypothetical protein